jgi:hypothetical protein
VNQLAGTAAHLARVLPSCAEGHDPFAVAMEDERADCASGLQPFVLGKLAREDRRSVVSGCGTIGP